MISHFEKPKLSIIRINSELNKMYWWNIILKLFIKSCPSIASKFDNKIFFLFSIVYDQLNGSLYHMIFIYLRDSSRAREVKDAGHLMRKRKFGCISYTQWEVWYLNMIKEFQKITLICSENPLDSHLNENSVLFIWYSNYD